MDPDERIPLKRVKFVVAQQLAFHNLQRSLKGKGPLSINAVARLSGVSPTTIHRCFRGEDDSKRAVALSLDLASRLCSVLECEVGDLLTTEVVEGEYLESIDKNPI